MRRTGLKVTGRPGTQPASLNTRFLHSSYYSGSRPTALSLDRCSAARSLALCHSRWVTLSPTLFVGPPRSHSILPALLHRHSENIHPSSRSGSWSNPPTPHDPAPPPPPATYPAPSRLLFPDFIPFRLSFSRRILIRFDSYSANN